jgi:hypothetical protein
MVVVSLIPKPPESSSSVRNEKTGFAKPYKSEIMASIKDIPLLSRNTVTRIVEAMSEDVTVQLQHDFNKCTCFSLQFDESTDAVDTAQLSVFVRMAFEDGSVKKDILTVLSLKETTKGESVYNERSLFKVYVT